MIGDDFLRYDWHNVAEQFRLQSLNIIDLTQTTATINWSMSDICSGQVEWGPTNSYGNTTQEQDISGGFFQHTQTIEELAPGIQYHFRTKSTSSSGFTVFSPDTTFTTQGVIIPPSPSSRGPRPAPAIPSPASNVFFLSDTSIPDNTSADVGSALTSWVNSKPSGSILVFAQTGNSEGYEHGIDSPLSTYRMEHGIRLNTSGKTLWGYGVKFIMLGDGRETTHSGVRIQTSKDIKVLGFEFEGTNALAGTFNTYSGGPGEFGMGVAVYGDSNIANTGGITVEDNWVHNIHGDCFYTNANLGSELYGDFTLQFNLYELTGRQGITANQGDGWSIGHNIIRDISLSCIDSEDSQFPHRTLDDVHIFDNLFQRWNWHYDPPFPNSPFTYRHRAIAQTYNGDELAHADDWTIEDNTFDFGATGWGSPGNDEFDNSAAEIWAVHGDSTGPPVPKKRWIIRNNTFTLEAGQQVARGIKVEDCDTISVTGNVLPGQTISLLRCTDITESGNTSAGRNDT